MKTPFADNDPLNQLTPEQRQGLETAIDTLAADPDFILLIKQTEARPPTTKNHYGDYMALLDRLGTTVTMRYITAKAAVKAGASREGVADAFKLIQAS